MAYVSRLVFGGSRSREQDQRYWVWRFVFRAKGLGLWVKAYRFRVYALGSRMSVQPSTLINVPSVCT